MPPRAASRAPARRRHRRTMKGALELHSNGPTDGLGDILDVNVVSAGVAISVEGHVLVGCGFGDHMVEKGLVFTHRRVRTVYLRRPDDEQWEIACVTVVQGDLFGLLFGERVGAIARV